MAWFQPRQKQNHDDDSDETNANAKEEGHLDNSLNSVDDSNMFLGS